MTFVDNNCVVFDAREEEGELHHTELHIQFTSLVERLLETQLEELGLSADDFSAIVLRSGKSSPLFRLLSTHLLALDDFETFRRLMVKRNLELELQAIQAVRASGRDVSLSAAAPSSTKGSVVEESDDDALRRAIAMSEADAESARQLAEMEAAVLEAAVAESLALEVSGATGHWMVPLFDHRSLRRLSSKGSLRDLQNLRLHSLSTSSLCNRRPLS